MKETFNMEEGGIVYRNCCRKCGGTSLHTEAKGSNTGLYCDICGAWLKWLSKDELRAFEYGKKNKVLPQMGALPRGGDKGGASGTDAFGDKPMARRLNEFVEFLDKKIDSEYGSMPVSMDDAIRKNSYCLALEQDKRAIQNILSGHDFNYVGD